jgi:hypothetical protein
MKKFILTYLNPKKLTLIQITSNDFWASLKSLLTEDGNKLIAENGDGLIQE